MQQNTIADLIAAKIAEAGVSRVYGIVGDSLNPISDALRRRGNIEFIHVRHEETAAFACSAEAQLTGKLAVCAGTAGPGNLHLLNGLYDANRSHAPVLAIASHIPSSKIGTDYFQETHPKILFSECSKYCELAANASQFPQILQIAIQQAISQKGVATIVIPGDISALDFENKSALNPDFKTEVEIDSDEAKIVELASLINSAQKPAIFCGAGCANARAAVLRVAQLIKAPLGYTMRAKQFFGYDNPYENGMLGLLGWGGIQKVIENCDLFLIFGSDFPYGYPENPQAKIVQIDILGENLGRRTRVDLAINSDINTALKKLIPLIKEKTDETFLNSALSETKKARADLSVYLKEISCTPKTHPEYAAYLIDKYASDSAVFTVATGLNNVWAARYINAAKNRNIIGSFWHGSMACEIPMAIGAQLAYPERQVVALCGDGGISMLFGDLMTIKQYNLPIKMFVFNNSTLGFIDLEMLAAGYIPYATSLVNPSFADLAKVFGFTGIKVENSCKLEDAVKQAFAAKGPVLVDIATDPNAISLPPKISTSQAAKFSLALSKLVLSANISKVKGILSANLRTLKTLL